MNIIDMHCDTLYQIYNAKREGRTFSLRDTASLLVNALKMKAGGYLLQNFAAFVDIEEAKEVLGGEDAPYRYAKELVRIFKEQIAANSDLIRPAASFAELQANQEAGVASAMLTLEEGGICLGDIEKLREFYQDGARMMTLTWNYENEIGYPAAMQKEGSSGYRRGEKRTYGLKETGIQFLSEMEALGMIIDVSHLSDDGFFDVYEHTTKPFVASHSNARALVPDCPRDLTDDMIRALSERGGVAGINYFPPFLSAQDPKADRSAYQSRISDMIRHMKHMKQVGGIRCIGLGSDFDGIHGDLEMKDGSELSKLEWAMRKEGFTESEIEAVFYGNVLRVYKEVL